MPEKHEHHHWLIAILGIAVIALIALTGFFAYELFYGDRIQTIKRVEFDSDQLDEALAEQSEIIQRDLDNQEEETASEEEDAKALLTFSGSSITPSFSYPQSWHVFVSGTISQQPGIVNTIFLSPEPIQILEATDATPAPIIGSVVNLAQFDLQGSPTYNEYITNSLSGEFTTNLEASTRSHQNGTLTTITGRQVGGLGADHNFEYVVYETANYAVSFSFRDRTEETDDNIAWNDIKTSFDFSSIQ